MGSFLHIARPIVRKHAQPVHLSRSWTRRSDALGSVAPILCFARRIVRRHTYAIPNGAQSVRRARFVRIVLARIVSIVLRRFVPIVLARIVSIVLARFVPIVLARFVPIVLARIVSIVLARIVSIVFARLLWVRSFILAGLLGTTAPTGRQWWASWRWSTTSLASIVVRHAATHLQHALACDAVKCATLVALRGSPRAAPEPRFLA
jgi:hypothetical protein